MILDRFMRFVSPEPNTGCWLWTGAVFPEGYGSFYVSQQERTATAHRVSYEAMHGPVPAGLQLDHLCRVRCCVNPDHLEAVYLKTNVLRGEGSPAKNARKTVCKNGHPFTVTNTRITPKGERQCRTCAAKFQREYAAKLRARTGR